MFIQQELNSHDKLWDVNDTFIDSPGMKFTKNHSPLIEATVEQWGHYQFDNAPIPHEMETFVERFVDMLGITGSKYSSVRDVCHAILLRTEYDQPYFFLVDMPIKLVHNELMHTYRHKKTGSVLNPANVEIFALDREWDFRPYEAVKSIMEQPEIKAFREGRYLPAQFESREAAMESLLIRISNIIWGDYGISDFVESALCNHEEGLIYEDRCVDGDEAHDIRKCLERDRMFWVAAGLGAMTWFKGKGALPFLTEYHVVYSHLLDVNEAGQVTPVEGTGDEVIVDGVDIYTHRDLDLLPNRSPDSCACCGEKAHCTKYINVTALTHGMCSCGRPVDPMDVNATLYGYGGHNSSACRPYDERFPAKVGFVCQRCIFKIVNNLAENTVCGRSICPAVHCKHHMGAAARIRALTHQRTKQLAAPVRP